LVGDFCVFFHDDRTKTLVTIIADKYLSPWGKNTLVVSNAQKCGTMGPSVYLFIGLSAKDKMA